MCNVRPDTRFPFCNVISVTNGWSPMDVRPVTNGDGAAEVHRSLAKRSISPHSIRHSTAMHMLQSGVAFNVIALWLGHESASTTHRYVEADLAMKDEALARLQEPDAKTPRYRPPDALKKFLQEL
jgi:hypothetical protein